MLNRSRLKEDGLRAVEEPPDMTSVRNDLIEVLATSTGLEATVRAPDGR